MKHTLASLLVVLAVAVCVLSPAIAQKGDQAEVQLKAAINKEVVDGDLKAAIDLYRKVAQSGNRPVAARALIRMGQCYEKLGDREARKAYEQVVREYADQKEAVEQARALLAAGSRNRQGETGISVQLKRAFPAGRQTQMRHVSPDGRYIPFDVSGNVWLHDLTTGEERRVTEGKLPNAWATSAELSPDSRQIAYAWGTRKGDTLRYELRIADVSGSGVRVLMADQQNPPLPKAWSPDGRRILILMGDVTRDFSHSLVSVADGSVQVLTSRDYYSNGCFSPDGKYIVAYRGTVKSGGFTRVPGGLTLIPVDGTRPVPLFESSANNWGPFWAPDGRTIVFLGDRSGSVDLWSIRMSGGRAQGEPELVKREAGAIDPDPIGFTRDGSFHYKTSNVQSDIYAANLDPATGRVISKPAQFNQRFVGSVGYPMAWSQDGQFLAYARRSRRELGYNVSKVISFIVRSEKTGEEREIAPVPAFSNRYPQTLIWLSDGRSFLADDFGKELFFRQIDIQTGQAKVFVTLSGSDKKYFPVLSPDEKALFYVQYAEYVKNVPQTCRLMRRDMESGEVRELYQANDVELDNVALSFDGRQLAFDISDWNHEPNAFSLMIMPAEGGAARGLLRSKSFIGALTWTRDGRHVLMMRESESGPGQQFGPYQLWSVPVGGGEAQPSGLVKPGGFAVPADVALHPDGRRLTYSRTTGPTEELWVIKNLLLAPGAPRK
jgi:Tol biopolymer transport system component